MDLKKFGDCVHGVFWPSKEENKEFVKTHRFYELELDADEDDKTVGWNMPLLSECQATKKIVSFKHEIYCMGKQTEEVDKIFEGELIANESGVIWIEKGDKPSREKLRAACLYLLNEQTDMQNVMENFNPDLAKLQCLVKKLIGYYNQIFKQAFGKDAQLFTLQDAIPLLERSAKIYLEQATQAAENAKKIQQLAKIFFK